MKAKEVKSKIQFPITVVIALLFSYAAVSKLADPGLFRAQLYLHPFPHALADVLVFTIPALEMGAIGLLWRDRTRLAGLWLSAVLLGAFTAYVGLILLLHRGALPCSCGGILSRMSWTVHLLFNSLFVLAAAIAIALEPRTTRVRPPGGRG